MPSVSYAFYQVYCGLYGIGNPTHRAGELVQTLRERAILVRHVKSPGIDNHMRISIGADEECAHLVTVLAGALGQWRMS